MESNAGEKDLVLETSFAAMEETIERTLSVLGSVFKRKGATLKELQGKFN